MNRLLAGLALVFALSVPLAAQGPARDWHTIETQHFRVHYPIEFEAWATRAASRLEPIHAAVSQEVGFTPAQRIDVLVVNPIAEPNGSAWTFLDTPRIILFTEPPGPDEVLGAYGSWIDLLAVHEVAHVIHMLRPSRNPFDRWIERALPLNPITRRAPRWVLEGYATVVEGRLTGAGRPSSTMRALILRQLAQNGRLPTYAQLNSDQRFLGMSMAYLMGSAYLEWLEQRSGPESLRSLWARLTAREKRSFEGAFTGVFGESPERLYGQFLAEVTASAITIRRSRALHDGMLFQETTRASGHPAVSPDGKQLAIVLRPRDLPETLVVWSTGSADEEEAKFRERLDKILGRDPEDVAPVRGKPLPRKTKHELVMPDGGDFHNPRWARDGKSIVFSHRVPDAEGVLHFDLYRWDFENVSRLTHLADVRDAEFVDDHTLIAVRSRYGLTELVTIDLHDGARITPRRASPSLERIVASPRVSASGRVAYVAHDGARWTLFIDDQPVTLPGDAATPAWITDDQLVVTVFERGFAELYRVSEGMASPITRTGGGAFEPAPSADGKLFFLSLQPHGYDVRVLERVETLGPDEPLDAALVPAIPPIPSSARVLDREASVDPSAPRPYGVGRQEHSWFASLNVAPQQQGVEVGLRLGDVVGRHDPSLVGSLAHEDGQEGVAVGSAWRGWPVTLQGHAFHTDDADGFEARGVWSRRFPQSRLTFEAGALAGDEDLLFASGTASTFQRFGAARLEESVRIELDDEHWRGVVAAAWRSKSLRVGLRYQRDSGTTMTLGGLASSVLPESAYAHRLLDPALPVAILNGDDYDGWRLESTVPGLPVTAFYQRHHLGDTSLSLAGVEIEVQTNPNPIVKFPGLALTAGVAYVLDAPLRGETKGWLGMRWRP